MNIAKSYLIPSSTQAQHQERLRWLLRSILLLALMVAALVAALSLKVNSSDLLNLFTMMLHAIIHGI